MAVLLGCLWVTDTHAPETRNLLFSFPPPSTPAVGSHTASCRLREPSEPFLFINNIPNAVGALLPEVLGSTAQMWVLAVKFWVGDPPQSGCVSPHQSLMGGGGVLYAVAMLAAARAWYCQLAASVHESSAPDSSG